MIHVVPLAVAAFGGFSGLREWRRRFRLSESRAETAWHKHFPGDCIRSVILGTDGRTALIETNWGIGVICQRGRFAQRLDGALVEQVNDGLEIVFPSPTAPRITVPMPPVQAASWAERIAES